VQGRGDIASKQQGSPRTDYNKLATLIERKGKLSALFACNAMPIKVGEGFCNLILYSLCCSTELVGSASTLFSLSASSPSAFGTLSIASIVH
jgi:hypothetical protein